MAKFHDQAIGLLVYYQDRRVTATEEIVNRLGQRVWRKRRECTAIEARAAPFQDLDALETCEQPRVAVVSRA